MNDPRTNLAEQGLEPDAIMGMRSQCVCFNIRRASRAITKLYEERLGPFGVHAAQYSTLMVIATAGDMGVVQMAKALSTDRTTLSRTIKPLIENGWVQRVPGPDKRTRGYRLTESGIALVKQVVPVWREVQREVMEIVGGERFDAFVDAADNLLAHLGEEDPDWLLAAQSAAD